ncbi:MAG: class I SAM-dependent methyltransferase [Limisphaerales bacterium]
MSKRTIKRVIRQCFDPFIRLAMPIGDFQRLLLEPAGLCEGEQVLDVGCGTGALAVLTKRLHPHTDVFGIDWDADALDIAKVRAARTGVVVTFQQGTSAKLPFPDASLDHAFSTFVFHHLNREQKQQTLREIIRVLRPGGALHIADFGRPQNWLMRLALVWIRLSHRLATISDNVSGALPQFVRTAGFEQTEETARLASVFGTVCAWQGRKPATVRMGCRLHSVESGRSGVSTRIQSGKIA